MKDEREGTEGLGLAPERMAEVLYHDLLSPEEVRQVRAEVREFAQRRIAPIAHEIAHTEESPEAFPSKLFLEMGKGGLFAIPFGKEYGGRGLKHRVAATAAAIEEIAYISNSVAAVFDVHCILAGHALEFASEALQERWLRPLIAGQVIGSFATTEPGASTDLSVKALETFAEQVGNEFVVNGRKRFITNAPIADFSVVLCRTGETLSMIVVDLRADGVRIGPADKKMGNHGQLTADIFLENVRIPVSNLVGRLGQGLRIALATLTYGRIGIAASGVGMAQSVFDECVQHLKSRQAFGKKIGQFQHWQFRMAERATAIEHARNLCIKAAMRMDAGVEFPEPEAAMAKYYATEVAVDFARDGVQIFGGYGFMRKLGVDGSTFKVEEVYRDSKITEIYEGTNEIQKLLIARAIFGKDITA